MFEGFELTSIDTEKAKIRVRHGGSGPPLLLLHGHPQTHVMWHKVAPRLALDFTIVAADLRGYGASSKPPTTDDHEPYSKRAMAHDQVRVMQELGFDSFSVAGHDRGGRCAYRMALDHPERVEKLAVLDIVPTGEVFRHLGTELAFEMYHWFFLAQPHGLPERLISKDPDAYYFHGKRHLFEPEALEEYLRCARDPETIHAFCEDYRAGITFDRALDDADRGRRKIECPVLALWSGRDYLARSFDVLEVWRTWADDVRGRALDCGHYLAEEAPDETYEELRPFFSR
ncbi:MAG: alpha/beta fold hydrolase [Actinomycetota bacterium]